MTSSMSTVSIWFLDVRGITVSVFYRDYLLCLRQ